MKKNNKKKKGFTLVELLAVIIILAIVVGITIPAVLTTTNKARKKSFNTAVDTIRTYIQDQVDMARLPAEARDNDYESGVATANCTDDDTNECKDNATDDNDTNVLTITGYDKNIGAIMWSIDSGKVVIECATALEDGEYIQSDEYDNCSGVSVINTPITPINPGGGGLNPPVNPGI